MNKGTPLEQDDIDFLHNTFSYDSETGCLLNKLTQHAYYSRNKRVTININNKIYDVARIIWMIYYNEDPSPYIVDHKNNKPWDNRISNLRLATQQQNCFNNSKITNSLYPKGISLQGNYYVGTVTKDGRAYRVKSINLTEAIELTRQLRVELHGEFANHGDCITDQHYKPKPLQREQSEIIRELLKALILLDRLTK